MIELTIKQYLEDKLKIPVVFEIASDFTKKKFVLIEKLGSNNQDKLYRSSYAFKVYDESLYKTMVLSNIVKSKIEEMIELADFAKIKIDTDYNFTDTETKKYRYQIVVDIWHY